MGFGDLAGQHQSNTRTRSLGGKERHKQVRSACESWSFIANPNFNLTVVLAPTNLHRPLRFDGSIRRIPHKVYQELFQLNVVALDHQVRSRNDIDRQTRFQTRHPLHQLAYVQWFESWLR